MPTKWGLLLSLFASTIAADYTWWIDPSCKTKLAPTNPEDMINEAFETAALVQGRMSRTKQQEPDAYATFQQLFFYDAPDPKASGDDAVSAWNGFPNDVVPGVKDMFAEMPRYTKETSSTNARQTAEIRIYCDNDDRLTLVPDDPRQDVGTINSKLDLDKQQWYDSVNQIEVGGTPGCKLNSFRTDKPITAAITYYSPRDAVDADGVPQAKNRASITLCDAWISAKPRIDLMQPIKTEKLSLTKAKDTLTRLGNVGSAILYHEMHHHARYRKIDIANSYGWELCTGLKDVGNAFSNAESFTMMGVAMQALDRGYAIDRRNRASGQLIKYSNIPASPLSSSGSRRLARSVPAGGWAEVEWRA